MATRKAPQKTKNNKTSVQAPRTKLMAVVFIALFALIGGYWIYKSNANPLIQPAAGEKLIIERTTSTGDKHDANHLVARDPVSFRVYESGLTICGGYKDPGHPEQYYSTMLTSTQRSDLVSRINQTGFTSIATDNGVYGSVSSANYQTVSMLDGDTGKAVTVDPRSKQLPKPYTDTGAIIDALCAGLSQPYSPETVTVTTKVISDPATTGMPDLTANSGVVTSSSGTSETSLTGVQAKAIHKAAGKSGLRQFKKDGATVEVEVNPLPAARYIENGKNSTTVSLRSKRNAFSPRLAEAATLPVKYYVFCATYCDVPQNTGKAIGNANDFFWRNIRQVYDFKENGQLNGRHPWDWYRTCHGYGPNGDYVGYCSNDVMSTIHDNIDHELFFERGWAGDSPRQLLLGFNPQENLGTCGVADIGGKKLSIATFSPANCHGNTLKGGADIEDAITTHELGHTFGLTHRDYTGTLMDSGGRGCADGFPVCILYPTQANWLVNNSEWLHPKK